MTSAAGTSGNAAKVEEDQELIVEEFDEEDFSNYFDLLSMDEMVIIRSYQDDEDDRILEELRPRYLVMYEPDVGFVRRVEVSGVFFFWFSFVK